jgi:hypothetical protein
MYITLSYQRAERPAAIAHAQAKRTGLRAEDLATATLNATLTFDDETRTSIPNRTYDTHAINRVFRGHAA